MWRTRQSSCMLNSYILFSYLRKLSLSFSTKTCFWFNILLVFCTGSRGSTNSDRSSSTGNSFSQSYWMTTLAFGVLSYFLQMNWISHCLYRAFFLFVCLWVMITGLPKHIVYHFIPHKYHNSIFNTYRAHFATNQPIYQSLRENYNVNTNLRKIQYLFQRNQRRFWKNNL